MQMLLQSWLKDNREPVWRLSRTIASWALVVNCGTKHNVPWVVPGMQEPLAAKTVGLLGVGATSETMLLSEVVMKVPVAPESKMADLE